MTNNTTTTYGGQWEDILAASVLFLSSLIGLFAYILFIATVYRTKEFRQNSYYLMAASLGVLDSILLVGMMVYSTPCTILQVALGGDGVNGRVGGILLFGWFGSFPLICFLALNRYFCICRREMYKKIFNLRNTKVIIGGCVTFGLVCGIVCSLSCCYMLYFPADYTWAWNIEIFGSWVLSYFDLANLCFTVIFAGGCNVVVFRTYFRLHREIGAELTDQRHQAARREREFKLFVQFFVIMLYMTIFDVIFNVAPYLSTSKWMFLVVSWMYILNCSINAYVYILMSQNLRRKALELMMPWRPKSLEGPTVAWATATNTVRVHSRNSNY